MAEHRSIKANDASQHYCNNSFKQRTFDTTFCLKACDAEATVSSSRLQVKMGCRDAKFVSYLCGNNAIECAAIEPVSRGGL